MRKEKKESFLSTRSRDDRPWREWHTLPNKYIRSELSNAPTQRLRMTIFKPEFFTSFLQKTGLESNIYHKNSTYLKWNVLKRPLKPPLEIPFALLCIDNYSITKLYVEGCFIELRDDGTHLHLSAFKTYLLNFFLSYYLALSATISFNFASACQLIRQVAQKQ